MSGLGKMLACAVSAVGVAGALAVLASATTRGPNGQIAFKQALGAPSRLAIVRPDGAPFLQLPRTKQVSDDDPDWSPNGSTIAFTRCPIKRGPCGVFTMGAAGTGLKRLGPASDDRAQPSWSPDGRQIAYSRVWGGVQNDQIMFAEIYVMNATGGGARRVTGVTIAKPFSADVEHPAWSPDGKELVFAIANSPLGDPANGHALFVVNTDGSELRQLTPWNLNAGGRLDWSPDGKLILFRAPAKTDRGNLYTIASDGTRLRQLTHYPPPTPVVSIGSFSPDGKFVTFAKSANVWVMRVDGTGGRQITRNVSAWSPDWGHGR